MWLLVGSCTEGQNKHISKYYPSKLISNLGWQLPLHKEMEIQNSSVQSIAETSYLLKKQTLKMHSSSSFAHICNLYISIRIFTYIQLNTFKTTGCSLLLPSVHLYAFQNRQKPAIL
jgi:hypothetical protein